MGTRTFSLTPNNIDVSAWDLVFAADRLTALTDGNSSSYIRAPAVTPSIVIGLTSPGSEVQGIVTTASVALSVTKFPSNSEFECGFSLLNTEVLGSSYTDRLTRTLSSSSFPISGSATVDLTTTASLAPVRVDALALGIELPTWVSGSLRITELSEVSITLAEIGVDAIPVGF